MGVVELVAQHAALRPYLLQFPKLVAPFTAPPSGPLQSLSQWHVLPQFLRTSPPLPHPLLRVPFTKASTSLLVNQAPRVCGPLVLETPQRLLLVQRFLLLTYDLLRKRLRMVHQALNLFLLDHGVLRDRLHLGNQVRNLFLHGVDTMAR